MLSTKGTMLEVRLAEFNSSNSKSGTTSSQHAPPPRGSPARSEGAVPPEEGAPDDKQYVELPVTPSFIRVQSSEFISVKNDKLTRKALTEPLPANSGQRRYTPSSTHPLHMAPHVFSRV